MLSSKLLVGTIPLTLVVGLPSTTLKDGRLSSAVPSRYARSTHDGQYHTTRHSSHESQFLLFLHSMHSEESHDIHRMISCAALRPHDSSGSSGSSRWYLNMVCTQVCLVSSSGVIFPNTMRSFKTFTRRRADCARPSCTQACVSASRTSVSNFRLLASITARLFPMASWTIFWISAIEKSTFSGTSTLTTMGFRSLGWSGV